MEITPEHMVIQGALLLRNLRILGTVDLVQLLELLEHVAGHLEFLMIVRKIL